MSRTQRQYLADIIEAMTAAMQFVEGREMEDLEEDRKTQWALERAFLVIGEAAKKVAPELRNAHPEVPWALMAGMRDRLVHGYWAVRLDIVWATIHRDFPAVLPHLERILAELPPADLGT